MGLAFSKHSKKKKSSQKISEVKRVDLAGDSRQEIEGEGLKIGGTWAVNLYNM
jgi:hypothetical protein